MDTLPVEMLERIFCLLPPRDLARCAAVCREWREIINQDWIWKQYCDPELEEPLRTTPCIATPAFTSPEVENSTLSPICPWRLAFMRENHLRNKWRRNNHKAHHPENNQLLRNGLFASDYVEHLKFLTDTLVVFWYECDIDIFDVSIKPAARKATTRYSVEWPESLKMHDKCSVLGTSMLLVEKKSSVQVYKVDLVKESIELQNHIILTQSQISIPYVTRLFKEHFYFFVDDQSLSLKIFDLNNGEILKEEPYPVPSSSQYSFNSQIFSSSTSDYVAVAFYVKAEHFKLYILSIKELTFLPGIVIDLLTSLFEVTLHSHWLAYCVDSTLLTVYNFQTREVLLEHEGELDSCMIRDLGCCGYRELYSCKILVCDNSFIFTDKKGAMKTTDCHGYPPILVKSYNPLHKTLINIFEVDHICKYYSIHKVINNKLLALIHETTVCLYKISSEKMVKEDDSLLAVLRLRVTNSYHVNMEFDIDVNRSCTIMVTREKHKVIVSYLW